MSTQMWEEQKLPLHSQPPEALTGRIQWPSPFWQFIKLKLISQKKGGIWKGSQSRQKEGALLAGDRNVSADGLEVVSVAAASSWHRLSKNTTCPSPKLSLCNHISCAITNCQMLKLQKHLFLSLNINSEAY